MFGIYLYKYGIYIGISWQLHNLWIFRSDHASSNVIIPNFIQDSFRLKSVGVIIVIVDISTPMVAWVFLSYKDAHFSNQSLKKCRFFVRLPLKMTRITV